MELNRMKNVVIAVGSVALFGCALSGNNIAVLQEDGQGKDRIVELYPVNIHGQCTSAGYSESLSSGELIMTKRKLESSKIVFNKSHHGQVCLRSYEDRANIFANYSGPHNVFFDALNSDNSYSYIRVVAGDLSYSVSGKNKQPDMIVIKNNGTGTDQKARDIRVRAPVGSICHDDGDLISDTVYLGINETAGIILSDKYDTSSLCLKVRWGTNSHWHGPYSTSEVASCTVGSVIDGYGQYDIYNTSTVRTCLNGVK
jgi:hypothetical protein